MEVVECKQQGDLQLGKLLLHVLVVPGLDRNLVSVGNTPHTTKWEFDKHGATCNNNNGDNLLTASARRSLLRQGDNSPLPSPFPRLTCFMIGTSV